MVTVPPFEALLLTWIGTMLELHNFDQLSEKVNSILTRQQLLIGSLNTF